MKEPTVNNRSWQLGLRISAMLMPVIGALFAVIWSGLQARIADVDRRVDRQELRHTAALMRIEARLERIEGHLIRSGQ